MPENQDNFDNTPKRSTFVLKDRLDKLEHLVKKLSGQIKIYGAIVTLGAVAIPAYGQIRSAYAKTELQQIARDEIVKVVREIIDRKEAVEKLGNARPKN